MRSASASCSNDLNGLRGETWSDAALCCGCGCPGQTAASHRQSHPGGREEATQSQVRQASDGDDDEVNQEGLWLAEIFDQIGSLRGNLKERDMLSNRAREKEKE